jgi:phosphohistidine phosphatase
MMNEHRLIIMRHATAESGANSDHARALTSSGEREARDVGRSLRANEMKPDLVLCSTAIRCRETWRSVSAELGEGATVDYEAPLYNGSAQQLLHCLAGVIDAQTVLLLAHNPGVSMLAIELAHGDEASLTRLRSGFAPATIAQFDFDGPWSTLSSASARLRRFEPAMHNHPPA